MTLDEFKTAYPELHAQIEKAAFEKGRESGFATGRQEGVTAGAEAERDRIRGIEASGLPGHETLIATLKYDGKTTPADAALAVIAAERQVRTTAAAAITSEAIKPVPAADASAVAPAAPKDPAPEALDTPEKVEAAAKADWEKDAKVRAEFGGNYEDYKAFRLAEAGGVVRIFKAKGGN